MECIFAVNITAGGVPGKPEAVLLRALEPVVGEDLIAKRRRIVSGKVANLTNGPGRLCAAMGITRAQNKLDVTLKPLYINDSSPVALEDIVATTRVGVNYAGEWKTLPWRFYIKGNGYVSVK